MQILTTKFWCNLWKYRLQFYIPAAAFCFNKWMNYRSNHGRRESSSWVESLTGGLTGRLFSYLASLKTTLTLSFLSSETALRFDANLLFVCLFVCVLYCKQSGGNWPEAAFTAGGSEPTERGGLCQTCLLCLWTPLEGPGRGLWQWRGIIKATNPHY